MFMGQMPQATIYSRMTRLLIIIIQIINIFEITEIGILSLFRASGIRSFIILFYF